jgi:dihydroorotate dehydrogenase
MSMLESLLYLEQGIRPRLQRILPPSVFIAGVSQARKPFLEHLGKSLPSPIVCGEAKTLFSTQLRFRNDLGNAAGLDKDGKLLPFSYRVGAGFAVVGTVLRDPHVGRLTAGLFGKQCNAWAPLSYSHSALNSLGLPSPGMRVVADEIARFRSEVHPKDFPIGVSVMGHPLHEGQQKLEGLLETLEYMAPQADFFEINESCPNTEFDTAFPAMLERLEKISRTLKSINKPTFVKLASIGEAAEMLLERVHALGFTGLALVNTQTNYIDLEKKLHPSDRKLFQFYTKRFAGGVSGRAIADFALAEVRRAADLISRKQLPLQLIHVGGIANGDDIVASRSEHAGVIVLREWYTGFMEALGKKAWSRVYPEMFVNPQ